jgi:multiple sugar transport system permease protein
MDFSHRIEKNLAWIFPLPAALFVLLMMIFPVLYTLNLSLNDWNMMAGGKTEFVGLLNYSELLQDQRFWMSVLRTFYLAGLAVAVQTVLGVAIAILLHREFKGKNLMKLILLLPIATTPVAIGLAWTLFYEPTIGLANYSLGLLHLPPLKWIASNATVIPSIALVDIWEWTPLIALICLAGLAGLPVEPFESAYVDGVKGVQMLRYITLPLLKPTIVVAVVLRTIDALKTFDIIYVMTTGGPGFASETLNIFAYDTGFKYMRFGSASAALVALFIIVLLTSLLVLKLRKSYDL